MTALPRRVVLLVLLVLAVAACASSPTASPPSPSASMSLSPVPATATPTATATPRPRPTATMRPAPSATRRPTPRPTASPTPRPASPTPKPVPPPPLPPGANSLFVLGDSVLISAEPNVRSSLHGWVVTYDAVGSRRLPQGIQVLKARRAEIGRVVVIQQGNNYLAAEGSFGDQIDQAMRVLQGTSRVVWLTVAEKWPSRVEINRQIRAAAGRWPTIVVGDWARMVAAHPEYAGDQLHLSPAGRQAIAGLIAQCVGHAP